MAEKREVWDLDMESPPTSKDPSADKRFRQFPTGSDCDANKRQRQVPVMMLTIPGMSPDHQSLSTMSSTNSQTSNETYRSYKMSSPQASPDSEQKKVSKLQKLVQWCTLCIGPSSMRSSLRMPPRAVLNSSTMSACPGTPDPNNGKLKKRTGRLNILIVFRKIAKLKITAAMSKSSFQKKKRKGMAFKYVNIA